MRKWISPFVLLALMAASLPAGPALAEEPMGFRIVLVPERSIFEQESRYRMLCDYLCSHLPVKASFEVLRSYRDVMSHVAAGKADAGFMGSFLAYYGIERYGLVPTVRPEWTTGESHYRSYIFKRSGSPLSRDVSSWKGLSMAVPSRYTSAGFFFPMALIRGEGITDPESYLEMKYTGSHDTAIWMVANGLADMGAVKNTVFDEVVAKKPELGKQLEILFTGGYYPDLTLMVNREVPDDIVERVRQTFLEMSNDKEGMEILRRFGASRFIGTTPDDFEDVRDVVQGAGYDIRTMKVAGPGRGPSR